jgi:hypothetical protein
MSEPLNPIQHRRCDPDGYPCTRVWLFTLAGNDRIYREGLREKGEALLARARQVADEHRAGMVDSWQQRRPPRSMR